MMACCGWRVGRAALGAVGVVAVLVLSVLPAFGAAQVSVSRLAGPTRYDTAAAMSRATFGDHRYDAVLARGDLFPDALAAAGLAGAGNGGGPILLTAPDALPAVTLGELQRLTTQRVAIMGDTSAIGPAVEAELVRSGFDTYRLDGATRYDTAVKAGLRIAEFTGDVILASGENFADAMAAGDYAYANRWPLLLTPSDALPPVLTQEMLTNFQARRVMVVGGTKAVSPAVVDALRRMCVNDETAPKGRRCLEVTRVAGNDRLETATALADWWITSSRQSVTHVNLTRGDTWPDAVAGAGHSGFEGFGAVTLFAANPSDLSATTRRWLQQHAATIQSIHVYGDADAISQPVADDARRAATSPG